MLENLRDALGYRSKIIQLKHKGKGTRRRDTMYTWTISTIPAFRDIVSRIAGNIRTPKKLKGFKRMLEKAALYLPSLTLPSQESIVTEEPNVYWIQAYESGGVVLPDVPFLDISKYVQDVGYDYWFVGFDAGDGGHHAGKGTKEGEDDRPKNHVIEIDVYQVERAVLEKIQLHYKRGAVYPTPERPVRERYFRFTSEDDVAFGLNDVLFGKHVHDNRLRQHQQMAVAFPLRFPHSKHTILYPESLREGPMHPWTMTGLADADGSFNAYFGRKENGKRTVHIRFRVTQASSHALKQKCREFFGVGTVNEKDFSVDSIVDLKKGVAHFDEFKLKTWKQDSYVRWREVWEGVYNGEHLTEEGFRRRRSSRLA